MDVKRKMPINILINIILKIEGIKTQIWIQNLIFFSSFLKNNQRFKKHTTSKDCSCFREA